MSALWQANWAAIGPAVDEEEMKINSCRKKSTTLKISSSARDFLAFLQ
jgi:hypothetical protein